MKPAIWHRPPLAISLAFLALLGLVFGPLGPASAQSVRDSTEAYLGGSRTVPVIPIGCSFIEQSSLRGSTLLARCLRVCEERLPDGTIRRTVALVNSGPCFQHDAYGGGFQAL